MWKDLNKPKGKTTFSAFPPGLFSAKMIAKANAITFNYLYCKQLEVENVKHLTRLDLFQPQNNLDSFQFLQAFVVLLSILFGEKSII
jgi:hypothetical protein